MSLQLSQQLDGLLGMLCADVAPADGASIQQNLKLLEEKLQTVGLYPEQSISLFSVRIINGFHEAAASY